MPFGFINRVSSAGTMRQSLDVSSARTRAIADRVSKATMQNGDGFALAATATENAAGSAQPGAGVDLEAEMVSLGDEQLRYEATAKLLQGAYQKVRLAMKSGS